MTSKMVCTCIAINHPLHKPGACDEPPRWKGGVCVTCRYWWITNPPPGEQAPEE